MTRRGALGAVLVVALVACGGLGPPTPTAGPLAPHPATPTAAAATVASTAPNAPTAAPSQAVIPGLSPVDVTVNLKNKGLDCTGIRPGKELHSWACKGPNATAGVVEFAAEVWGPSVGSVSWVNAQVFQYVQPTDEIAATFLGYVSTLPYDGAQPDQARRWVEANLPRVDTGKPTTTTIGGATFELVGPPAARFLQIKALGG